MSSVTGQTHGCEPSLSPSSFAENAARTPGRSSAGETSMFVIRACAIGLRRIAMYWRPGSWMLSVQVVRPVTSRASSLRRSEVPTDA